MSVSPLRRNFLRGKIVKNNDIAFQQAVHAALTDWPTQGVQAALPALDLLPDPDVCPALYAKRVSVVRRLLAYIRCNLVCRDEATLSCEERAVVLDSARWMPTVSVA